MKLDDRRRSLFDLPDFKRQNRLRVLSMTRVFYGSPVNKPQ